MCSDAGAVLSQLYACYKLPCLSTWSHRIWNGPSYNTASYQSALSDVPRKRVEVMKLTLLVCSLW